MSLFSRGCRLAQRLASARASGLTDPERLRLEQHLSECDTCAADAAMLAALRELSEEELPTVAPTVQRRVIERALDAADEGHAPPPKPVFGLGLGVGVGALTAAAVLAVVWGSIQTSKPPADRDEASSVVATIPAQLVEGDVRAGTRALESGQELPAQHPWHTEDGARVVLPGADIELAADTQVRWRANDVELFVDRGGVELAVQARPTRAEPFTVVTGRFRAVVLGTRFEVTQNSVTVHEGIVRVLGNDGAELATLRGGGRWSLADDPVAATEDLTPASEPAAVELDLSALLGQARRQIARNNTATAQATIERVLANEPTTRQAAEAHSLRAEISLVRGDRAGAARHYQQVARRYPALPAGENALFAAARLHDELGRRDSARTLLETYIARYPRGRFHREASRRLGSL